MDTTLPILHLYFTGWTIIFADEIELLARRESVGLTVAYPCNGDWCPVGHVSLMVRYGSWRAAGDWRECRADVGHHVLGWLRAAAFSVVVGSPGEDIAHDASCSWWDFFCNFNAGGIVLKVLGTILWNHLGSRANFSIAPEDRTRYLLLMRRKCLPGRLIISEGGEVWSRRFPWQRCAQE